MKHDERHCIFVNVASFSLQNKKEHSDVVEAKRAKKVNG
jgi:hypothetical protein